MEIVQTMFLEMDIQLSTLRSETAILRETLLVMLFRMLIFVKHVLMQKVKLLVAHVVLVI